MRRFAAKASALAAFRSPFGTSKASFEWPKRTRECTSGEPSGRAVRRSEHVLDSDVDVAISTLLESFINSQKHSVKTALRRTFRKYLVRPEDSFALIM